MRRARLASARVAAGLSQEALAEAVGIARSTVARWEAGESTPAARQRTALAAALRVTLAGLSDLLDDRDPTPALEGDATHADALAAMEAFRVTDRLVGGGQLYPGLVRYLAEVIGPRLMVGTGPGLVIAAAGLTEMAGWMAHDAGQEQAAEAHFRRALDLAAAGHDPQLSAHILASLAHLLEHLGRPVEALEAASSGRAGLGGIDRPAGLDAQLLAMEARAHAQLGDQAEAHRAIDRAERALTLPTGAPASPWIHTFDQGSLASEGARTMAVLGDWAEAERQARAVLILRPDTGSRARALGLLHLGRALMARGWVDGAAEVADEITSTTTGLRSALVDQQRTELVTVVQTRTGRRPSAGAA